MMATPNFFKIERKTERQQNGEKRIKYKIEQMAGDQDDNIIYKKKNILYYHLWEEGFKTTDSVNQTNQNRFVNVRLIIIYYLYLCFYAYYYDMSYKRQNVPALSIEQMAL